MKNYSIGVRVWLSKKDEGHFLGNGRIELLENIKKTGSITKGAESMKMSYRQAWQMVQDINARAKEPYVEKILGGKGGGGARITSAGENAIKVFHEIDDKIAAYAKQLTKDISL